MKPTTKVLLTLSFICLSLSSLKAQTFGDVVAAGLTDGETYLQNYLAPAFNSFGNGLAGGWYNTAKAHKIAGIDLTIGVSAAFVPSEQASFLFDPNDYENLEYTGTDPNLPTMVGGAAETGSQLRVPANSTIVNPRTGQSITIENEIVFDTPAGIGFEPLGLPAPTFHVGIGLIKNTDVKIRFIPEIESSTDLGDLSTKMFGFGIMHDFKQWIPGIKNLPFDLSAFFGTTKATFENNFTTVQEEGNTTFEGDGQLLIETRATTFQVLISKKLAVFTPYAGLGFNTVKTNLQLNGDYEYTVTPVVGPAQTMNIEDPYDIDFTGEGGPRLTIGGRLKLAVITLHVDYTVQTYSALTFGLGISVR